MRFALPMKCARQVRLASDSVMGRWMRPHSHGRVCEARRALQMRGRQPL